MCGDDDDEEEELFEKANLIDECVGLSLNATLILMCHPIATAGVVIYLCDTSSSSRYLDIRRILGLSAKKGIPLGHVFIIMFHGFYSATFLVISS